MELDEMKNTWRAMSVRLDTLDAECTVLRLEMRKERAVKPLRWTRAVVGVDLASDALMLVLLGTFVAHQSAWRFIVPALILYLVAIVHLASSVRQLIGLVRMDFGDSLVTIQRRLERVYILRLRTLQATLLACCLLWVPLAIVLWRGVFGIDLYALGWSWLAANVALGIVAIPVLWWLARRFGAAFGHSAFGRFLLEDVTGHGLAAARRRVAALAQFAAEGE